MDEMLDSITPQQFDELYAAEMVDNPPGKEEREVMLACTQHNAALLVAASMGAKVEQDQFLEPADFLPHLSRHAKRGMSTQDFEAVARSRYGG